MPAHKFAVLQASPILRKRSPLPEIAGALDIQHRAFCGVADAGEYAPLACVAADRLGLDQVKLGIIPSAKRDAPSFYF